jgi:hypothetical protein
VALNSNCEKVGGCDASSPQGQWLQRDLAAHPETTSNQCTLAYFHHPRYATGNGTNTPNVKPFWDVLYANGADVILSGHAHRYELHNPMTPEGVVDRTNGIRPFVVGTGGEPGGSEIHTDQVPPGVLEKVVIDEFGVIKLALDAGSYTWAFIAVDGTANGTVIDSGTEQCHGVPGNVLSAPSNLSATRSGSLSKQRINLTWTDTSSSEENFVIERSTTSSFTTNLVTYQRPANTGSYSDSSLQRQTTYYYRIFAVDSTGTRSDPSNVASATTK